MKVHFLVFVLFPIYTLAFQTPYQSIEKCKRVLRSYCGVFSAVTKNNGFINMHLVSGEQILCDDGRDLDMLDPKQYALRINEPDVASLFIWDYPFGKINFPVTIEQGDPGRIRVEGILKAAYGSNEKEVSKNLVKVKFLGQTIRVNAKMGAAVALEAVSKELENVANFKQNFWQSREFSGSFNWRKISGTNRLSVHSFGAAVDFTVRDKSKKTYWKWVAKCIKPGCEKVEENLTVEPVSEGSLDIFAIKNSELTPEEVVGIFEKHGYIWGGKWHHFDTMHFEYRPEFLDSSLQPKCELEDQF